MASIDTIALDDRLSYVLPYVNGAPASTVRFHLRQAAIQFCRRTLIWQATLDPVLTVVNQDTYPIPLPDDARLVNLMAFRIGDREDSDLLTPAQGRWQRRHQTRSNRDGVFTEDRQNFIVLPMPKIAGQEMVLDVALCPTEESLDIPAFIADQYIQDIAHGAIGTIQAVPRQSFTDKESAKDYTTQFNNAISRVARLVSKGNAQSKQRVRGHFF